MLGPSVLDPRNIAWLAGGGDTTQHYLGWAFYRYGPWTNPLGLNPQFGLEVSSSIVFSDSIPLFAFMFKPFTAWLPEPFQYLGIWMLLCFVLQACFAWLLIGLFSIDWAMKLLGAVLLVFAPPMLFRLIVHIPLASHFIVLAALYLALRQTHRYQTLWWGLLLCASALINFYLLVMSIAVWVADNIDRTFIQRKNTIYSTVVGWVVVSSALLFCFWQAGYLALGSSPSSWGLGFYRMNALSIINPMGWSYFIETAYKNSVIGEYEGFNYFGLGLLVLALIAIYRLVFYPALLKRCWQKHPALLFSFLVLTMFALTPHVGFGDLNIQIPISEQLLSWMATLRSSGRLFWPVWYSIALMSMFVIARTFTRLLALLIFSVVLIIQVGDTSAKWLPWHRELSARSGSQLPSPLKNSFWDQASIRYSNIVRRPLVENPSDWDILASYAAQYQMGTDSVYLARVDSRKFELANQQFARTLESGAWDTHSLYAIENTLILPVLSRLDPKRDLFVRIDNQNVLAPSWLKCQLCPPINPDLLLINQIPRIKVGEQWVFSSAKQKNDLILAKGWWPWPDSWGTWSSGQEAQIQFLIPSKAAKRLTLLARALISPSHPVQRVQIKVNGRVFATVKLDQPEHNVIEIPLDAQMHQEGYLAISLLFLDAVQPKAISIGSDDRYLAIGIESARFE